MQSFLEAPRIVIVAQALNDHVRFRDRDVVPGFSDPLDNGAQPDTLRIQLDRGALRGEVNGCGLNPVDFFDIALNRRNAIRTGHARYGQR